MAERKPDEPIEITAESARAAARKLEAERRAAEAARQGTGKITGDPTIDARIQGVGFELASAFGQSGGKMLNLSGDAERDKATIEAQRQKEAAAEQARLQQRMAQALSVFGLQPGATLEDVQRAYQNETSKRLSAAEMRNSGFDEQKIREAMNQYREEDETYQFLITQMNRRGIQREA